MIINQFLLCLLVLGIFASNALASDSDGGKALAEKMWDQAIKDHTVRASSAYEAYLKLLPDASANVVKALEADLKNLNDIRQFRNLDIKERAEAVSAVEVLINLAKGGVAVAEAVVERSSDYSGNLKQILVGSSWKFGKPSEGASHPVSFEEDGSVKNPWNEPWKYEVKNYRLVIHAIGSSGPFKEIVFALRGNTSEMIDLRRVHTLTKE